MMGGIQDEEIENHGVGETPCTPTAAAGPASQDPSPVAAVMSTQTEASATVPSTPQHLMSTVVLSDSPTHFASLANVHHTPSTSISSRSSSSSLLLAAAEHGVHVRANSDDQHIRSQMAWRPTSADVTAAHVIATVESSTNPEGGRTRRPTRSSSSQTSFDEIPPEETTMIFRRRESGSSIRGHLWPETGDEDPFNGEARTGCDSLSEGAPDGFPKQVDMDYDEDIVLLTRRDPDDSSPRVTPAKRNPSVEAGTNTMLSISNQTTPSVHSASPQSLLKANTAGSSARSSASSSPMPPMKRPVVQAAASKRQQQNQSYNAHHYYRHRTTTPPSKSTQASPRASIYIHRTSSLDALVGPYNGQWPRGARDYDSIICVTRSTQTPEAWANDVNSCGFVEETLLGGSPGSTGSQSMPVTPTHGLQHGQSNCGYNSNSSTGSLYGATASASGRTRTGVGSRELSSAKKPEDITLKQLPQLPYKREFRRIQKTREREQKRASSPIHANHNAIPVGSRSMNVRSSPYAARVFSTNLAQPPGGTTAAGHEHSHQQSNISNNTNTNTSSSTGTSPTPNNSNSNSLNSTPIKTVIARPRHSQPYGSQEALNREVESYTFDGKKAIPIHGKTPPDGRRAPVPLLADFGSPMGSLPNVPVSLQNTTSTISNNLLQVDLGLPSRSSPKRTGTPVSSAHSRQDSNTSVTSTQTREQVTNATSLIASLNLTNSSAMASLATTATPPQPLHAAAAQSSPLNSQCNSPRPASPFTPSSQPAMSQLTPSVSRGSSSVAAHSPSTTVYVTVPATSTAAVTPTIVGSSSTSSTTNNSASQSPASVKMYMRNPSPVPIISVSRREEPEGAETTSDHASSKSSTASLLAGLVYPKPLRYSPKPSSPGIAGGAKQPKFITPIPSQHAPFIGPPVFHSNHPRHAARPQAQLPAHIRHNSGNSNSNYAGSHSASSRSMRNNKHRTFSTTSSGYSTFSSCAPSIASSNSSTYSGSLGSTGNGGYRATKRPEKKKTSNTFDPEKRDWSRTAFQKVRKTVKSRDINIMPSKLHQKSFAGNLAGSSSVTPTQMYMAGTSVMCDADGIPCYTPSSLSLAANAASIQAAQAMSGSLNTTPVPADEYKTAFSAPQGSAIAEHGLYQYQSSTTAHYFHSNNQSQAMTDASPPRGEN